MDTPFVDTPFGPARQYTSKIPGIKTLGVVFSVFFVENSGWVSVAGRGALNQLHLRVDLCPSFLWSFRKISRRTSKTPRICLTLRTLKNLGK